MTEAWVTYIAKKRARRRAEIAGQGTAQPLQGESEPSTSFVKDERTGLLLPEGARVQKRQPGFGAEWND